MKNSESEKFELTCPECNTNFLKEIWFIVDSEEHPDLIELAKEGNLNMIYCPNGHNIRMDGGFVYLLFFPGKNPVLTYVFTGKINPEEINIKHSHLLLKLKENLGPDWDNKWISRGIPAIPMNMLPQILVNGFGLIEDLLNKEISNKDELFPGASDVKKKIEEIDRLNKIYKKTGNESKLERAIDIWKMIIDNQMFSTWPRRFQRACLKDASALNIKLFQIRKSIDNLDDAIKFNEIAISVGSDNLEDLSSIYNSMGLAIEKRFEISGDIADIKNCIYNFRMAHRATDSECRSFPQVSGNLGRALMTSYDIGQNYSDLQSAINCFELSIEKCRKGSTGEYAYWANLGFAIKRRYHLYESDEDLDESIAILSKAKKRASQKSSIYFKIIDSLGILLLIRHSLSNKIRDSILALENFENVFNNFPDSSPIKSTYLNNYANGFDALYRDFGKIEYLELAIKYFEKALRIMEQEPNMIFEQLLNIGWCYQRLFEENNEINVLESAIIKYRHALNVQKNNSKETWGCLNNLGTCYLEKFEVTQKLSDLDMAIQNFEWAYEETNVDSDEIIFLGNNICNGYRRKYELTGNILFLDTSLEKGNEIKNKYSNNFMRNPYILNTQGLSFSAKYCLSYDLKDLENSINYFKMAIELLDRSTTLLPNVLSNLAGAYNNFYLRTNKIEVLNEAINLYKKAIKITPKRKFKRIGFIANIGSAYLTRYEISKDYTEIKKGISCLKKAIKYTPVNSPDLSIYYNNLGKCLIVLSNLSDNSKAFFDVNKAFEMSAQIAEKNNLEIAIKNSQDWGDWALEKKLWEQAYFAYFYGIRAFEYLFATQFSEVNKERWLKNLKKIHYNAAYALAKVGRIEEAVLLIEKGKVRLSNDYINNFFRFIDDLPNSGHKELYDRYNKAKAKVRDLENNNSKTLSKYKVDNSEELKSSRCVLNETIDNIKVEFEKQYNYNPDVYNITIETIKKTLTEDLYDSKCAVIGIYLITTKNGGLAIIIHYHGIKHVWLNINDNDLVSILIDQSENKVGLLHSQLGIGETKVQFQLNKKQFIINERLVRPLIAEINKLENDMNISKNKHILTIIIPTGHLSLLPLPSLMNFEKDYRKSKSKAQIFIYIPSAATLLKCKNELISINKKPNILAIAEPKPLPPIYKSIACSIIEVDLITKNFKDNYKILKGTEATKLAVDNFKGQYSNIHFATHAFFNNSNPLSSGICLSNEETISLYDLYEKKNYKGVRLVTLSACMTGINDFNYLPEEIRGLPNAFIHAGVIGVIGTLWQVNDFCTMLFMKKFYDEYISVVGEGIRTKIPPPIALKKTQTWLRNLTNNGLDKYLDKLINEDLDKKSKLLLSAGKSKFKKDSSNNPEDRPFEDIYYWGGFIYYGL